MRSTNYSKISDFFNKRIIEIIGILIILSSFFLLLSLLTYYPEDQYFSSRENVEIHNLLGELICTTIKKENELNINTSNLSKGIYVVELI